MHHFILIPSCATAVKKERSGRKRLPQNGINSTKMQKNNQITIEATRREIRSIHFFLLVFSREKSLLSNWVAAASAASTTSNNSSDSSDSSSSVASTPSTTGNIEALTKQVAALEVELKERNEKLETANERLSDRELEISILQKRLELRATSQKNL